MSPTSSASSRPRDDLRERVRETVDIADVVGSYISLRRAGRGLVGLCPWHDDARPSLQVNPERQTYRCWVCNIGGDVFNFVMRMEKLEFREALEQLADRCGIALPRGRGGISADDKANLRDTLAWAAARYRDCLRQAAEAAPARSYLAGRGLSAATLDHFDVGFVPAAWDWLLRQAALAGISAATLAAAGLVVARNDGNGHYDRFRGRVMFPIRDAQGRCIAFGGRVLPGSDDPAKYVNSPETPLFSKRSTLYGLDTAREAMSASRRAVVVEGYTDCLAARQAGIGDVVAVLGTALGAEHAKVLRRYADRVVLVLDGDEAGRRRADEILDLLLAEPIDVRIARLPSGADPCDYLTAEGHDAFEQVLGWTPRSRGCGPTPGTMPRSRRSTACCGRSPPRAAGPMSRRACACGRIRCSVGSAGASGSPVTRCEPGCSSCAVLPTGPTARRRRPIPSRSPRSPPGIGR
jgi:DNA primase